MPMLSAGDWRKLLTKFKYEDDTASNAVAVKILAFHKATKPGDMAKAAGDGAKAAATFADVLKRGKKDANLIKEVIKQVGEMNKEAKALNASADEKEALAKEISGLKMSDCANPSSKYGAEFRKWAKATHLSENISFLEMAAGKPDVRKTVAIYERFIAPNDVNISAPVKKKLDDLYNAQQVADMDIAAARKEIADMMNANFPNFRNYLKKQNKLD